MTHVDKCATSVVADGDGIKYQSAKIQKCEYAETTIPYTLP